MTLDHATALEGAIARLQTELNRLDRLTAATLQVGSAEDLQVLRLLLSAGPRRVGEIASMRCSSVANISARLDRMERRGLVVRERLPGDRRAVVAVLTETGRDAAAHSQQERLRLLRPVSPNVDIESLDGMINALAEGGGVNA